jgi:hypothetical protein
MWSEPQSFVLTLTAAEPQIDTEIEPDVEILAALLPERRQPPVQHPAIVPEQTTPQTESMMLALAERPADPSPAVAPAESKPGEELLIDQAIWMIVNPANPLVSG